MALESQVVKTTTDAATKSVRLVDAAMKKFWSILDAAEQKKSPSEYLTPKGIGSIQGGV